NTFYNLETDEAEFLDSNLIVELKEAMNPESTLDWMEKKTYQEKYEAWAEFNNGYKINCYLNKNDNVLMIGN
ncbi:MAG: hypothetical protein LBC92_05865, partial [Rickettsiales bacterium]|nr:hypothetical protein [Rickettsiales bacterium]